MKPLPYKQVEARAIWVQIWVHCAWVDFPNCGWGWGKPRSPKPLSCVHQECSHFNQEGVIRNPGGMPLLLIYDKPRLTAEAPSSWQHPPTVKLLSNWAVKSKRESVVSYHKLSYQVLGSYQMLVEFLDISFPIYSLDTFRPQMARFLYIFFFPVLLENEFAEPHIYHPEVELHIVI